MNFESQYLSNSSPYVVLELSEIGLTISVKPVLLSTRITYGSDVFNGVRPATATTPARPINAPTPPTPKPTFVSVL